MKKDVRRLYKLKLEEYKNCIDDLPLSQRALLFRLLMKEAVIEAQLSRFKAERCEVLKREED